MIPAYIDIRLDKQIHSKYIFFCAYDKIGNGLLCDPSKCI